MREKPHSSTVFLSCWLIYFLLQMVTKPVTIRMCSSMTKTFTLARPCKFYLVKTAPTTLALHTGQRLALRDWCQVHGSGLVLPGRTRAIFHHHRHYIAGLEKPGSLNASWLSSPDSLYRYIRAHTHSHTHTHVHTHTHTEPGARRTALFMGFMRPSVWDQDQV